MITLSLNVFIDFVHGISEGKDKWFWWTVIGVATAVTVYYLIRFGFIPAKWTPDPWKKELPYNRRYVAYVGAAGLSGLGIWATFAVLIWLEVSVWLCGVLLLVYYGMLMYIYRSTEAPPNDLAKE